MKPVELYPHQRDAIEKMHNGCVLWGGVGTGKSLTSLAYFIEKECHGSIGDFGSVRAPRDLYVITTAKKRNSLDWESESIKFGITRERSTSMGGITLTVDSWNNIGKYKEVKDAFFIFDEQRVVGSGAWTKSFIKIAKQNRWVLLSATPADTWLDLIPVFVANGYYKNRSEFKREHVIYNSYSKYPKVDRYVGVGKLVKLRNKTLVHMPYRKHTTRVEHMVDVDFDVDLYEQVVKKRWHIYEDRPIRNVSELFSVMRKVVNSDDTRIEALTRLLTQHPKVIVFYNFDYELEMLRELAEKLSTHDVCGFRFRGKTCEEPLPCASHEGLSPGVVKKNGNFGFSEWNGHKHEEIPETDGWLYAVQYAAGAEGWNCTTTDSVIFLSLSYSFKMFEQSKGRIDRLNTPFSTLNYYVFRSKSAIDQAIWKALKSKQNFNESAFFSKM